MKQFKKIFRKLKFTFLRKPSSLIEYHFKYYTTKEHLNYNLFKKLFLDINGPLNIIETGSSAWGFNSSHLFDNFVKKFGGKFITVDIRPEVSNKLNLLFSKNSVAVCSDSISFFNTLTNNDIFDLVFLDSFDLDISNPEPAMNHCFQEFNLIKNYIKSGSIIIIDDTPNIEFFEKNFDNINLPELIYSGFGKGNLVLKSLDLNIFEILFHEYSLVIRKI